MWTWVRVIACALVMGVPTLVASQAIIPFGFAPGTTSASLRGIIQGHEYVDYILYGEGNQQLSVTLSAAEGEVYFLLLPSGDNDTVIAAGDSSTATQSIPLPATGDYTLRVHQVGDDRDMGTTVEYSLYLSVQ